MAVKKFLVNFQVDMEARLTFLLSDEAKKHLEDDSIAKELNELQKLMGDTQFWELSATEPQGPNEVCDWYADTEGKWNDGDARFYFFQKFIYAVLGEYSEEQDKLLIQEAFDSERQKFERLKRKFAGGESGDAKASRQQIAEEVRIAVWRRDGGVCARCGSRERLEYDHIVPVSRGGSNTVRNIELLCEVCNRSKSNHIQ